MLRGLSISSLDRLLTVNLLNVYDLAEADRGVDARSAIHQRGDSSRAVDGELEKVIAGSTQVAGLAAARAVARLDDDGLGELVELHERMSRAADLREQQALNHEFHRRINLAADSPRMTSMLALLSRSLPMPYADFPAEWLEEANHQHRDILDAFRRRDSASAR